MDIDAEDLLFAFVPIALRINISNVNGHISEKDRD